ncbi:MAG: UPF0175 family protein [Caldilineaceae bacterium]
MTVLLKKAQTIFEQEDWQPVFAAAMRTGNFSSVDELYLRALDAWIGQLSPEARWAIAIDLYTREEVSSGRAAEIAGLNYFVFMEKLKENNIPFIAAKPATGEQKAKEEALLHELFDFSH